MMEHVNVINILVVQIAPKNNQFAHQIVIIKEHVIKIINVYVKQDIQDLHAHNV
jgi:hypothetical protein